MFRIIDFTSNLGGAWTPKPQQFRADTLEICNLTTRASSGKHDIRPLSAQAEGNPRRSVPLDDACEPLINLTILP